MTTTKSTTKATAVGKKNNGAKSATAPQTAVAAGAKGADKAAVDVSIIVPLYNEEESLPLLVERVAAVMRPTGLVWELVCVNDGSSDNTAQVLESLTGNTPELVGVYFRRNYGQSAAMQAGFDHACGRVFVTMDGDLQNDPSDIPMLLDVLEKEQADVVSGWRKNRMDDGFRSFLSRQANKLLSRVTKVPLHDYGCSLKAYRASAMEGVRIYGELHRFIPAVVSQFGAKVVEVEVKHHPREYGVSKYGNIGRTFRVVLDLLWVYFMLKFMHRPMHAFGMVGLSSLVPGVLFFGWLVLLKLFGEHIGARPLLLIAVMMILVGVMLIGMGVIGELLIRIYHEPAGRRQYSLQPGAVRRGGRSA